MQKCFCGSQIHIYYSAKQFTEGRYESIFIKGYLLEYFYKDQVVRTKYHVASKGTCPTRLLANLTGQGVKKSYNWFTRENAGKATSEYSGQVSDKYFG